MARKSEIVPIGAIMDICPGNSETICQNCPHREQPVALKIRFGCRRGYLTRKLLQQLITKDGDEITGEFVPGCKLKQKMIRRDGDGIVTFHLA